MIDSLLAQFSQSFRMYSKSSLKNLFIVTLGILQARSVNLYQVKDYLPQVLGVEQQRQSFSHYKRLLRFFNKFHNTALEKHILLFCFRLLDSYSSTLIMDGTKWHRGEKVIHMLVLAIVYRGVAVPIYWKQLDKKGISSLTERKSLLKQAAKLYDLKNKCLIADREYIGQDWFCFLKSLKMDFVIRIKAKNYHKHIEQAAGLSCSKILKIASKRKRPQYKRIQLKGDVFTWIVMKNPKKTAQEPLLFFLTTYSDAVKAVRKYPIRWQIEICFKHLKSNGFELEKMGFRNNKKITLLMAVACFAYTISIVEGIANKMDKLKKYKDGKTYPTVSVFRHGIALVMMKVHNLEAFLNYLIQLFGYLLNRKLKNVQ